MWLNLSTPNGPFDPPRYYWDMYHESDMPEPIDPDCGNYTLPEGLKPNLTDKFHSAIANYRKRYTGTITYMDSQIGRMLEYIKHSRFAENTMVVFFSDHGIMTGDHGITEKNALYKEILNPALIVHYPGKFKPGRIETAVELLDLGKTVLDIAQADEETMQAVPNGYSLIPLLTGNGQFEGPGYGFSEKEHGFRSIFDGRYKYIDNPYFPILFDLTINPDETINYAKEKPEVVANLKKKMDTWLKGHKP